jgi:hypothetical protein
MNISKAIAALSIALASPAAAKTYDVGESGNWDIKLTFGNEESMICSMISAAKSGHVFNLSVNNRGSYFLVVKNYQAETTSSDPYFMDYYLEFSSPTMDKTWALEDAEASTEDNVGTMYFVIGVDPYQRDFVQDFIEGDDMAMVDGEEVFATWPLRGSAQAVELFEECRQQIMGEV